MHRFVNPRHLCCTFLPRTGCPVSVPDDQSSLTNWNIILLLLLFLASVLGGCTACVSMPWLPSGCRRLIFVGRFRFRAQQHYIKGKDAFSFRRFLLQSHFTSLICSVTPNQLTADVPAPISNCYTPALCRRDLPT